jgi:hypothetical protein
VSWVGICSRRVSFFLRARVLSCCSVLCALCCAEFWGTHTTYHNTMHNTNQQMARAAA